MHTESANAEAPVYGREDFEYVGNQLDPAFSHESTSPVVFRNEFGDRVFYDRKSYIVKDRIGNRFKLTLEGAENPIIDPTVKLVYQMRPVKSYSENDTSRRDIATFVDEDVAVDFLSAIVAYKGIDPMTGEKQGTAPSREAPDITSHDKASPSATKEDTSNYKSPEPLSDGVSSYLSGHGPWSDKVTSILKNRKLREALVLVLGGIVIGGLFSVMSGGGSGNNRNSSVQRPVVSLSGDRTVMDNYQKKLAEDTTVIAEIERIQNHQPVAGRIGSLILAKKPTPQELSVFKGRLQAEMRDIMRLQSEMRNSIREGGNTGSVPFSTQTDRYGVPNVPPQDAWSASSGAKLGVPPSSQGVSSTSDLSDFGIKP